MKSSPLQFLILFGKTGCGKSEILRHISAKGGQVLDLEKLASHNGSAFGNLGKGIQPPQEVFEEEIRKKLDTFTSAAPVWVEYESSYLGKLQIPDFLLSEMERGKMMVIACERQLRIQRIINEYSKHLPDELLAALSKVKKKLSRKKYRTVRKSILEQDFQTAVSILITYYDKIYERGFKQSNLEILGNFSLEGEENQHHAERLLTFYKTLPLKSENPV
jgi:tRNA 2-selenouridine synthase